MRQPFALVLITVFVLVAGCKTLWPFNASSGAAGQPPPSATQEEAANEGLSTFKKLVTPQNYQALGFASTEDAQRAQLGEPMKTYRITLDALRGYQAGTMVSDILVDARRSLYPVEVDHRVATSIYVTQADDGWRATDFGNAAVARAIATFRRDKNDFVVQIPALKIYFLGRRADNNVTFTAVANEPRLGFKAGESMLADRALSTLQRAATGYNGLPQ